MTLFKCVVCKNLVPDVIVYWPLSEPADRRYVCRPDRTSTCFRAAVGDQWTHGIAAREAVEE